MTQLELQQRGLLDLIKGRGTPPTEPYLVSVAGSKGLGMIREIAVWWRAFQIEAQCYFTSRLLKSYRRFDSLITAYFKGNATSPFVEELSRSFLLWLQAEEDSLIHSVTQFEYAFLEVRSNSDVVFEVLWDRNPDEVFQALEGRRELPAQDDKYAYRMRIGRNLPGMFVCTRGPGRPETSSRTVSADGCAGAKA
jgi:hypothetical protein